MYSKGEEAYSNIFLLLLFYFFVVIVPVFAALPLTNITEYTLKEKKLYLSSVVDHTRCLLLFYSSNVWIYIHTYTWSFLCIYIYYCWRLLSVFLSLIFSRFLLLIDMVQNDYFFILMYICMVRKKKRGGLISFFRHNRSSSFSSTVHYRWKGHHMIVPKHLI